MTARPNGWPNFLDSVEGFSPSPFQQFILKLNGRCNLACDYCYVFEAADQSWRTKPARMSTGTLATAVARIAEHVREHGLTSCDVVLHGGEPTLLGPAGLEATILAVRRGLPTDVSLRVGLQTNGVLLDAAMLDILEKHSVSVAVSVDGGPVAMRRHRTGPGADAKHERIWQNLALLRQRPDVYAGLLCTVDLANDPAATFRTLMEHAPPVLDFLLPLATWDSPPAPSVRQPGTADPAPYGRWLARMFDEWMDWRTPGTRIRLFENIMLLLLGGASEVETVGLSPSCVVVVDTDGSIEQVDTLKIAYDGAPSTGLDVRRNSFDEALRHPGVRARQAGLAALAPGCRRCDIVEVCGGGYYPHRFRADTGFRNPSVYCHDMRLLIEHVRDSISPSISASIASSLPHRVG